MPSDETVIVLRPSQRSVPGCHLSMVRTGSRGLDDRARSTRSPKDHDVVPIPTGYGGSFLRCAADGDQTRMLDLEGFGSLHFLIVALNCVTSRPGVIPARVQSFTSFFSFLPPSSLIWA